ncbi:MAG: hypothetical protein ABEI76_01325 [Halobacteriales archaeon]
MSTEYYVTVDGDRVEGPFDRKKEARRRAAELSTNEIYLTYMVEAATAGGSTAQD